MRQPMNGPRLTTAPLEPFRLRRFRSLHRSKKERIRLAL